MSEWTVGTLKEHYDSIFEEKDLRYEQRFLASEKRLDGMNEFREALSDAAKTYITRSEAIAIVLLCCSVTGTIVAVITFFMRK